MKRTYLSAFLFALLFLLVSLFKINFSNAEYTGENNMKPLSQTLIIAHRGASKMAPENTIPAFKKALESNPDFIELDYHTTAEDQNKKQEMVVIHDGNLDRTTDAREKYGHSEIPVRSKTLTEIKTLDAGKWKGPEFEGTRIPTLKEAMDVTQKSGFTLIERKDGEPKDLVRFLKKEGWITDVVVQSFDWNFIRELGKLNNAISRGALGPPWERYKGRVLTEREKWLNAEFIRDIVSCGARWIGWNNWVTADSVALAHENDLRVLIYTVDDPDEAERLVALGVDGIITNDPETIAKRLRK